ncbi:MAG: hypothetical protein IPM82_17240 [Saprospiraceae bacterium]|nr:hypothetical protein [Saprospiraceae bacterium]
MIKNLLGIKCSAIVGIVLLSGSHLSAQVLNEADLLLLPTELLNLSTTGAGSDAYIQQIGSNNDLQLFQQQAGLEGNLARVLQSGDWNVAIIQQTESGNKLALIQKGTKNYYELVGSGTGNELVNIQDGFDNRIIQQFINSNQISSELVQVGNSNEIIQILENVQGQNFTIRQTGDGMKVIIRQTGQ